MRQPEYMKKLFDAFPDAFINRNNEIIISEKGNVYFRLDDVDNYEDLVMKILSWCSRDACKSMPYSSNRFNELHHFRIRQGCNKIIGQELSEQDWNTIYARLGNGCNSKLARQFVKSHFNMDLLSVHQEATE